MLLRLGIYVSRHEISCVSLKIHSKDFHRFRIALRVSASKIEIRVCTRYLIPDAYLIRSAILNLSILFLFSFFFEKYPTIAKGFRYK